MSLPRSIDSRKYNYWAFVFDGAFYFGAVALVAPESVLPDVLAGLGASNFLVALAPNLAPLGFLTSGILLAHRTEGLGHLKQFILPFAIPQRLILLVAVGALAAPSIAASAMAPWIVAASVFLNGFFGGLCMPAFFELYARSLAANRIASNLALRQLIGLAFGALAGTLVSLILERYPGPRGYAMLFVIQVVLMFVSLLSFASIREPRQGAVPPGNVSLWGNLAALPATLVANPRFLRLVVARALGLCVFLVVPFLATYYRTNAELPERWLGYFVTAQTLGGLGGNALAAWLGDQFGGRPPMQLGRLVLCAVCVLPLWPVPSGTLALSVFGLLGFGFALVIVGEHALLLRVTEGVRRPTLIAAQGLVFAPLLVLTGWAGSFLYERTGMAGVGLTALAALCLALLPGFRFRILRNEPQRPEQPDPFYPPAE